MLDYKLLEALAAVMQCGTFEMASEQLHITQSAVSQRIKLLEEHAGQLLLVRSNPPQLTDAGSSYIKHFKQVKHLEEGLRLEHKGKNEEFQSISLAVNADSLNTWFFKAICPYLQANNILLEIFSEDQDQTHKLLREGKVLSFIGTQPKSIQGCQKVYLGSVRYEFIGSETFRDIWFSSGLNYKNAIKAPILFYSQDDRLNSNLFKTIFKKDCRTLNNYFIPSTERFSDFITSDLAYGALPEQQSEEMLKNRNIVKLFDGHHFDIDLYFHFWNISSPLLRSFADHLISTAREMLRQNH